MAEPTSHEMRERFYNNLAIFSGGSIALSMTLLGNVKGQPLHHKHLLLMAWVSLIVCMILALLTNLASSHFLALKDNWSVLVERRNDYYKEVQEAVTASERVKMEIAFSNNEDLLSNIDTKIKITAGASRASGFTGLLCFMGGVILLVVFAYLQI